MKKTNQKGFTLIEVILVLAIGGLIFLLAFLAFQQVQRNRRDTQRRTDAARMASVYNDRRADLNRNPTVAEWSAAINSVPGLFIPGSNSIRYSYLPGSGTPNALQYRLEEGSLLGGTTQACIGLEAGSEVCRPVE